MNGRSGGGYRTGPSGPQPPEPTRCKRCRAWPCRCEPRTSASPAEQPLRVRRERAGRGGKTVTVVAPVTLTRDDAVALLGQLKKTCGSGGTLKVDTTPRGAACFVLELQGDHVDRVVLDLLARGYPAKPGQ